jgi:hypothetical protein
MKRIPILLIAVVAVALPAAASARGCTHSIAPPGNSGVNQYVETVPTAGGGCPTSTIHSGGTHGGAVSPGTTHALSSLGANGRGAAAFADATGTVRARTSQVRASQKHKGSSSHSQTTLGGPSGGSGGSGGNSGSGGSPASAVIKTLSGSGGGGGLGVLLPIILAAVAVAAAGLAVTRRRTA